MKEFAEKADKELTSDQRNMLSVAYKNVAGSCRAAHRVLSSPSNDERSPSTEVKTQYKKKIKDQLHRICHEVLVSFKISIIHYTCIIIIHVHVSLVYNVLYCTCILYTLLLQDLLKNHLIVKATDTDAIVFFHKMKGDYYRYLAESEDDDKEKTGLLILL